MLSPGNAYPKWKQLASKRGKPTQKQLGAISNKVRDQVKARSNGVCELCKAAHAVHMAHLIGRKQLTTRTTADISRYGPRFTGRIRSGRRKDVE